LLNALIRSGIVVPADSGAQYDERTIASTAKEALLDSFASHRRPEAFARHVAAVCLSTTYAHVMLKYRSFNTLLRHLRSRKSSQASSSVQPPIAQVQKLVAIFVWLRPFVYAEANACLFDSVALADFLYRHQIFPEILIGVRTQPFAAHSWVQHHGFVLNSIPDDLTSYTPILSI
jgi:hypothetical protein